MEDQMLTTGQRFFAFSCGVALLVSQIWLLWRGMSQSQWKRTSDTILSSELKEVDWAEYETYKKARIRYRYEIKGKEFEATRISLQDIPAWDEPKIHSELVQRYPAGRKVQVYYDPLKPKEAFLEAFTDFSRAMWMIAGAFLLMSMAFW